MALLFSLTDASAVDDPESGHFEADADGAFRFPDELSARLHRVHHQGQRAWETQGERSRRKHGEDLARRRDPAALYDAVGEFTAAMKAAASPAVSPDVAALLAQVEALTAQVAELSAARAGDGAEDGDDSKKAAPRPPRPA